MTNNHTLKNDCKMTLDAIRTMLPLDERQKIEPFLRDILDVTKKLMGNVKVSPEEHQALVDENQRLKRERDGHSQTIAMLNRQLEQIPKLQSTLRETEIEANFKADFITELISMSAYSALIGIAGFVSEFGVDRITRWISQKYSDQEAGEDNPLLHRTLLAMYLTVTSFLKSDEQIEVLLDDFLDATPT